ncbi:MAG: M14 family zinc carboxypeptidase [Planctomycetota bacterium]
MSQPKPSILLRCSLALFMVSVAARPALSQEAAAEKAGAAADAADAAAAPAAPARPLDHQALSLRLRELAAAHPELARVETLGSSLGGRAIEALVLAAPGALPIEERTGWLVVAGLDGRRLLDSAVLIEAVQALLGQTAPDTGANLHALLAEHVLVIVPRAAPDGTERLLGAAGPIHEQAGNSRSDDRDRDGRVDEDGPNDLDGDGYITWMRVPDSEGEWVLDAHDPRALRKAKPERGERGTHRLLIEGLDDDGDGEHGEDGAEGQEPDRNFPHRWPEHAPGAGAYPLSEPEARALLDYLHTRPRLLGVFVVGAQDTLVDLPKAAGNAPRGGNFSAPLDGVHSDDVAALKELQRRFQLGASASGAQPGAGPPAEPPAEKPAEHKVSGEGLSDGSFLAWAYHQAGRWPLALKLWAPPKDLPKPEGEPEAKPETKPAPGADAPSSDASSPVPAAVLAWLDRERDGEGFVPWHEFEHPEFGRVEIGGLLPGVLVNPSYEVALGMGRRLAPFLEELLRCLPLLVVEEFVAERQADGAYTVRAVLANQGVLPSVPQLAAAARTMLPLRVALELPEGAVRLHGPPQTLVDRLAGGGGRQELRWVIAAPAGAALRVRVERPGFPLLEQDLRLP